MELESLRALPLADQQIFLLGRIAAETTSMDAALRLVHAALRGQNNIDAFLDSPDLFSTNARECNKLIKDHGDLDDATRKAAVRAVSIASKIYTA